MEQVNLATPGVPATGRSRSGSANAGDAADTKARTRQRNDELRLSAAAQAAPGRGAGSVSAAVRAARARIATAPGGDPAAAPVGPPASGDPQGAAPAAPGFLDGLDAVAGVGNIPADLRWNFGDLSGGAGKTLAYGGITDEIGKVGKLGKGTSWVVDLQSVALAGKVAIPGLGNQKAGMVGAVAFAGVSRQIGSATVTVGGGEGFGYGKVGQFGKFTATPYVAAEVQGLAGPVDLDTQVDAPLDGSGLGGVKVRTTAGLVGHPQLPTLEATYGVHGVERVAVDESVQLSRHWSVEASVGEDNPTSGQRAFSAGVGIRFNFGGHGD